MHHIHPLNLIYFIVAIWTIYIHIVVKKKVTFEGKTDKEIRTLLLTIIILVTGLTWFYSILFPFIFHWTFYGMHACLNYIDGLQPK